MFSLDEKFLSANSSSFHSIQTLIIGRLVVTFLLLVTGWIWYNTRLAFSLDAFPREIFLVFIVSVGLTIVYFFLTRLSKELGWQIRLQFILDALLITWLVWHTGAITSPYIMLYIVLISISSLYLRPAATLLMAFVSIFLFVLLAVLTALSILDSTEKLETSRIAQIVSFHIVAFLVVGLLAARIADRRRSTQELAEATKSLADLRALHERIVESIRSGLITTDLDGNIYTFNAAAAEITGYRVEQVISRPVSELFRNIDQSIESLIQAARESEPMPRFEADLTTPDGFAVRVGYSVSQLYSEDNEATGLIITFQDLTEIRTMEENVRRKDRLAAVGRVGAGLAHEIRNPLGAMRGAIQLLESSFPTNSVHADLMTIILRESDRLNSIITNFLNYARPKAGHYSEIDVVEAIRDTLKLLRHSPEVTENHKLEDTMPAEPVIVSADLTQLKQIFWNLSRNAINAMSNGGKLLVSLEKIYNNRVRIIFEDTGCGMSPEQVEQLFEPFSSSATGSTGLGLSIVYQIIRDHNGVINVRSTEGVGTVITVELPRENHGPPRQLDSDIHTSKSPLKDYLKVKKSEPPA